MAEVIVNFKGADPVSGGARFDRVPEGTYVVKCFKANPTTTSNGKPALQVTIEIAKGPSKGKKVADWFVLPRPKSDDKTFGVQRLHGYMVACGIKRQEGKVSLSKIARALKGRECVAEIVDTILPATEDQKERPISSPQAYYSAKSKEGAAALKPKTDTDEEEDAEDEEAGDEEEEDAGGEDEDEDKDEDEEAGEDEEDEDEEPKKKSRKGSAGKASAKSKTKKSRKSDEDEDNEEDEDLYNNEDED